MTPEQIQNVIDAYTKLLIIQYNNKPKAIATIALIAREMLADGLIFDVQDAFDIESAIGVQLDILGKYIGLDRYYTGQNDLPTAFGFTDPSQDEPDGVEGFSDPSDFLTKDGTFLIASEVISDNQILSDTDFRFLLKLKIIQNTSNHSDKSIDDNLFKFFGTSVYAIDNYNMSMTYFVDSDMLQIVLIAIQKGVLTRPMGVLINSIITSGIYFAFVDPSTTSFDSLEGFAIPSDFETKDGSFLSTSDIAEI